VTAFVFSVVGLVNLWYSLKVSRADPGALVLSGAVTSALIVYLGVAPRLRGALLGAWRVLAVVGRRLVPNHDEPEHRGLTRAFVSNRESA
jgi:hypothetical protein